MKHLIKILCALFFFLELSCVSDARTTIYVRDQIQFDHLQNELIKHINAGERNIFIRISDGTYVFKENHISLKEVNASKTRIHLLGNNVMLIPEGKDYHSGDVYEGVFNPDNSWMDGNQDINVWSEIQNADGLIEVLDETKKSCRLKSKNPKWNESIAGFAYILIPHWYQSSVYKIDKIKEGYIYFSAPDLGAGYKQGYNVNDDYNYGKKDIRYKVCNLSVNSTRVKNGKLVLPSGCRTIHEGCAKRFIYISGCEFRSVEISGLSFYGNSFEKDNSFIRVSSCQNGEFRIHGCNFFGMRGHVMWFFNTPDVCVENNQFHDCYVYGIVTDNKSKNSIVKGNCFYNMGKRQNNTFSISCVGDNFLIADNDIRDFGYGGISTGIWYKTNKTKPCRGIVEGNSLVYSTPYYSKIANYSIMDGGAIYLSTKIDNVVVKYNYISNISGMSGNRGIFCDDGASNFQIYGNVITKIANSYSIDSRRVSYVEKKNDSTSEVTDANINNTIRDNVIDGRIRFEGNESYMNSCVKGVNYFIVKEGAIALYNVYNNVSHLKDDVELTSQGNSGEKVLISKKNYRSLQQSHEWRFIKKRIACKLK